VGKTRARISEKEVVLLGLIAEGPIHAYGLEQKMRERRITEWADISFSSIYRVLGKLTQRRLITTRLVQAGQGAARKVHEITEAGQSALAAGVHGCLAEMVPIKTPLSVGLAFICNGRHADVLERFVARADSVAAARDELERFLALFHGGLPPEGAVNEKGLSRPRWVGVHMLFDHFRRHVTAEHEFLSETIRLLTSPDGPTFLVGPAAGRGSDREVKS
jgi:DNA-binding PadR family transcriptional regulator